MNIKKTLTFLSVISAGLFINQASLATCWNKAGSDFNIDPVLLMAIGWQESNGKANAVGRPLKDGNVALGLMQINTIWLPQLKQFGVKREHLFDPCVSAMVGAYVLRDCLDAYNDDLWRSVGCYYGGKYSKAYTAMSKYSKSVEKHYTNYQVMFRGNNGFANYTAQAQAQPKNNGARRLEYIFFDQ